MYIRKAKRTDANDLKVLYFEYLTHFPPKEVKNYFVLFGGARKRPENQQNFQWIVTSFLYTTTFSIKL